MKKLFLVLFILSNLSYAIETDKYAHASVSYALNYTGFHLFPDSKLPVIMATIGLGLIKEIVIDSQVDEWDLVANGVGIGFSLIVIELE